MRKERFAKSSIIPLSLLLLFGFTPLANIVHATDLYEAIATAAENHPDGEDNGWSCKQFVNNVLDEVEVSLGDYYREAYLNAGYWITPDQATRGDLIQLTEMDDPESPLSSHMSLHSAIIASNGTGSTYNVIDSNWNGVIVNGEWEGDGKVRHRSNWDAISDAAGRGQGDHAYFYRVNNSGRTKSFLGIDDSATSNGLSNSTSYNSSTGTTNIAFSPETLTPYVSFTTDDSSIVATKRFEGSSWLNVGTSGHQGGYITFDSNGDLYRTWYAVPSDTGTYGSDNEIYVEKQTYGTNTWSEVGNNSNTNDGISSNSYDSLSPKIVIGSDHLPVVTWHNYSGGKYEIYVKKYNGSSWSDMGTSSSSGSGISNTTYIAALPHPLIDASGKVTIFWENATPGGNHYIYGKWFNTSTSSWDEIATNSASSTGIIGVGRDSLMDVKADSSGNIYLLWSDVVVQGYDQNTYIKKYDGTSWSDVGTGSSSGDGIGNTGYTTSWDGSLALDDAIVYAAWSETNSGNFEIHVKKFENGSWSEVLSGSGSGAGISNTSGDSKFPRIAVGKDHNPIVAWQETVSGIDQIYVKSFR